MPLVSGSPEPKVIKGCQKLGLCASHFVCFCEAERAPALAEADSNLESMFQALFLDTQIALESKGLARTCLIPAILHDSMKLEMSHSCPCPAFHSWPGYFFKETIASV